jgi:hypothetical protein
MNQKRNRISLREVREGSLLLLCRMLLTAGWGEITALLTVAMWDGMHREAPSIPKSDTLECQGTKTTRDASTSIDTFRSHTWRKKNSPRPARISNEVM